MDENFKFSKFCLFTAFFIFSARIHDIEVNLQYIKAYFQYGSTFSILTMHLIKMQLMHNMNCEPYEITSQIKLITLKEGIQNV